MRLLSLALCALLASCASLPRPAYPIGTDYTSRVVALTNVVGRAYCSGSITPHGVLTAAHCVDDDAAVYISREWDRDAEAWADPQLAVVLSRDHAHDLALVQLASPSATPLHVARFNARVGDPVVAIGHPLGEHHVANVGHVSTGARSNPGPRFRRYQMIDAGLIPGMSGGPVIDRFGEIVGVVSFYLGTPTLGGMIPAETVREFLSGVRMVSMH